MKKKITAWELTMSRGENAFLISQAKVLMPPIEKKVNVEEEDDDEIEEGQIVEDDDGEEEFDEEDFEDDDDVVDDAGLGDLVASLLATPEGDTVASALVGIRDQLETQNRILIKIFSALKN